jgi:DNA-directed RNA polymerase specialized sigma24 family protein
MSAALTAPIARCRVLCRPRSQATDVELLRRFAQQRDAAAFEELLERHAALVWGVCHRILPNEADCEDAFQATFLALVRRAEAVEAKPSLGAWLHTVAVHVSQKSRTRVLRQCQQRFSMKLKARGGPGQSAQPGSRAGPRAFGGVLRAP